jgi:hypothetical protein
MVMVLGCDESNIPNVTANLKFLFPFQIPKTGEVQEKGYEM